MNRKEKSQGKVVCILAGGKSRRMGTDKALVKLHNLRLIDIAVEKAREISNNVVVSCGKRKLDIPDIHQIEDLEGEGPIAGIYSVLTHFSKVLFFPVDMPYLSTHLLNHIWDLSENYDITICRINGTFYPTVGVYKKSCLSVLERAIANKRYSLMNAIQNAGDELQINILDNESFAQYKNLNIMFMNINTWEDLKVAERIKNR
ncbi:molybdopterin-guanine dinucleotide biosynthesis protein A [Thermosulfidibacter takaii ABI70S6]|uniref:Probable molybdenum cofactor guanylyltransferase n=1 Tax=Thermosulfidibacter takaii (strain DSM 17441 / JCM 13301 / NBRC 103674 / ABI70S6) TaxID=1298851 RepID=A0A0S3QRD6_THET7|nr:molybdenum cofactor guanylyltransferase [Thermosulfidibacter takaii]BAT70892.1 molybdopterin-guanine dinucleotide biosynthesis protein A [Thermosulfidibacter takaii ABI70S6]